MTKKKGKLILLTFVCIIAVSTLAVKVNAINDISDFFANSTGKWANITSQKTDGGQTIVDIYSKSDSNGQATSNIAQSIHQYRPGSTGLQIDHTNTGTMIGLTNAHNSLYGPQNGTANYISMYTPQGKRFYIDYLSHLFWVDQFAIFNTSKVDGPAFTFDTTAPTKQPLLLIKNNGVGKFLVDSEGKLDAKLYIDGRHEGNLQNGWVNYGNGTTSCTYWIDKEENVHLEGMIKGGQLNQPIFTLPQGYRPKGTKYFSINSNNAFGSVIIYSNGNVVCNVGSNVFVSLDGISFRI
jgi:hypothetical protein